MYLFFDVETNGMPKNWNRPHTDPFNWPRMVQIAWMLFDENRKLKESYDAIITELHDNLARVEEAFGDGPFFNGPDFALIDAAYAPIFIRLDAVRELTGLELTGDLPKVDAWGKHLLSLPTVQAARVPELPDLLRKLMRDRNSHAATLLTN